MGNNTTKEQAELYSGNEVSKAIEIWYNITQAGIPENKRKAWTSLNNSEKMRLVRQFKIIDKEEMIHYLELGRKNKHQNTGTSSVPFISIWIVKDKIY